MLGQSPAAALEAKVDIQCYAQKWALLNLWTETQSAMLPVLAFQFMPKMYLRDQVSTEQLGSRFSLVLSTLGLQNHTYPNLTGKPHFIPVCVKNLFPRQSGCLPL